MQPQTDEQRGKRACALSISRAMKGFVGRSSTGHGTLSDTLDYSPDSTKLRQQNSPPVPNVLRRGEEAGTWQRGAQ